MSRRHFSSGLTTPGALIAGGAQLALLGLVTVWFSVVDPYDNYYFQSGGIVVLNNVARTLFVLLLCWLIHASGAGVVRLLKPAERRGALTASEHAVLGFGFGLCFWHAGMLLLGLAGLYYRSIIVGISAVVLILSSRYCADTAEAAMRAFKPWLRGLRRSQVAGFFVVAAVALWLLMVQGLYPGGGGDYYTHYFYYYLAALRNHGLVPNDVWYHFYYSKGDGLFFLGMLLTDPTSHALATFACVIFAALAIAALAARLAPGTAWPLSGVLLYLMFYAASMSRSGGGEFQKTHELVTGLVVLMAWALCMRRATGDRVFLPMATACGIAIAIVNQPMALIMGPFFALLAAGSLLRRNWQELGRICLAGSAVAGVIVGILTLNYVMTGLASDQALNVTVRFADFERLDRWGVLPQIVAVAWLRNNFDVLVPPFGIDAFVQLIEFMRLNLVWPFLAAPLAALAAHGAMKLLSPGGKPSATIQQGMSAGTALVLLSLVGMLAVVSLFAGQAQNVSFSRLSTFFVPLLGLLSIACSAWVMSLRPDVWHGRVFGSILPLVALVATLAVWQNNYRWGARVTEATAVGLRFISGSYSFADAYSNPVQGSFAIGYPFNGINPAALAAARQVPPGTRIWSTNVSAYCMVPDCQIESVISFRMSDRLDQIVSGPPVQAMELLQAAGLNYFLVTVSQPLLDVLPFSRLFAPAEIGRYLGVKWTNGSTFLLTWAGPGTTPIGQDFLEAYSARLAEPETMWFRFNELVGQMGPATDRLRLPGATSAEALPWFGMRAPAGTVDVTTASYGESCRWFTPVPPAMNMVRTGNATGFVRSQCSGKAHCSVTIEVGVIGDVAPGCGKDFTAAYRCGGGPTKTVSIPAEATGKTVSLDCPDGG